MRFLATILTLGWVSITVAQPISKDSVAVRLLLAKKYVPTPDAIQSLHFYNPGGLEADNIIYPPLLPLDKIDLLAFEKGYRKDRKTDPKLLRIIDHKNVELFKRIDIDRIKSGGLIDSLNLIHRQLVRIAGEQCCALPSIALEIIDDLMYELIVQLNLERPKKLDEDLIRLLMEDIEANLTSFIGSEVSSVIKKQVWGPSFDDYVTEEHTLFKGGRSLRRFNFYIHRLSTKDTLINGKPETIPKVDYYSDRVIKKYEVYCVPRSKYLMFTRKTIRLNQLTLYKCSSLASVSAKNLPVGTYFFFAIRIDQEDFAGDPVEYNKGHRGCFSRGRFDI